MNFALEWQLVRAHWQLVYRFDSQSQLSKGRRSLHYWPVREAAREVGEPCGCYSWWVGSDLVYIGSFSPYSKKEFRSSLEGRLHNYLQSHGTRDRPNTNAWVFGNVVTSMMGEHVELRVLRFSEVVINGTTLAFEEVSRDKTMTRALESMLIASSRLSGACSWNRT